MEKVNKANTLADLILKYGKIFAVLGVIIGGGFLIYNQIQYNTQRLALHDEQFKEVLNTIKREFQVFSDRSDKRYKRVMNEAKELHGENENQDLKFWDINTRLSFIEGALTK